MNFRQHSDYTFGLTVYIKIEDLRRHYGNNHTFVCYTVGFGSEIQSNMNAHQRLEKMAEGGVGQMHMALDGLQLRKVFGHIAEGCNDVISRTRRWCLTMMMVMMMNKVNIWIIGMTMVMMIIIIIIISSIVIGWRIMTIISMIIGRRFSSMFISC